MFLCVRFLVPSKAAARTAELSGLMAIGSVNGASTALTNNSEGVSEFRMKGPAQNMPSQVIVLRDKENKIVKP